MRRTLFSCAALLVAAASIAACGDGGGTSSGGGCLTRTLPLPQLLFPEPGASGVPNTASNIIVAGVGPALGGITLVYGNTIIVTGGLTLSVPSPLPSPIESSPPGATLYADPYPTLYPPGTTFNVQFVAFPPGACQQPQQSGSLGSFTIQ